MAIERRSRSSNREEVVLHACPYCGADVPERRGMRTHLPCSETPTNDEIAEAKSDE
jgi:ssDNA-binding Zn-finger/Zn-ribbon topoisomerase 1